MHIDKNIILNRESNRPILIDTFYSKEKTNQPIIIYCHGYKGFKDWGAWNLMAETIANTGICFVKFNFSHNGGTIENPIDFPDLEAFGNNNYTKELKDLEDVIDWTQSRFKNSHNVNTDKIYLLGHSRGGGIAIITASEDNRISKLITLASVSAFGKRTSTTGDLEEWKKNGVKYVLNGRTKQQMPHYYQFYEDYKANEERLHIESAEKRLNIPHLIIHGDNDTSVSMDEALDLKKWNPKGHLEIIKGANHVFNVKHPWIENKPSSEFQLIIDSVINFIK